MLSISTLPRFDSASFQRVLRKAVIDKLVLGLKIALALLCLIFLALIFAEISSTKTNLRTAVMSLENHANGPATPSAKNRGPKPDYSILVRQPLLGEIDGGNSKPQASATPKVAANLTLGLIGVFLEDGEAPYAIVEDKKKNVQEVFNLEEMIFGEAKLKKILQDRIEIERNGSLEQLILDDLSEGKPDFKGGVAGGDNNQYVVDEAEIDKALENLPLLLTQARAVPYFKEGVSVGLRLFAIKSESMFEKLGLKNGDILKAVNGNSLGDITQAMKLFEMLKAERSISVKLERNMEEKEFKYEIK